MSVAIPTKRSRCYLVYALAPPGIKASEANRTINEMIGDNELPLALWHDHFLAGPGGCIIFFVENESEQQALFNNRYITDWEVDYRPQKRFAITHKYETARHPNPYTRVGIQGVINSPIKRVLTPEIYR